ncbi:MAG: hypothetical protein IJW02_00165 [Clostridia bacterium]|nr:hypothetical protein [Clostridia bacterium]
MKKISFVLALCLLLSFGMNVVASAEEYAVTPRYNNVSNINCVFDIENDIAYISINVIGYSGVTSRISAKAILEKKGLFGLWWSDVDEWTASSTNATETFEFTKDVGSGTYRCTFEVTVEGSGGSADVHTNEITVKN